MANKLELAPGTSWLFLLAYSVIALAALLWQVDTVSDETSVNQWCVSAVSISVALSALAVLATALMKDKFVGTAIDGGLAFLLLCFWAANMPYLLTPTNNLAVSGDDWTSYSILNSNLYFSSWLSLITAFVLWFQHLRVVHKVGSGGDDDDNKRTYSPLVWAGVCFSSFVVLVAAIRIYMTDTVCDENDAYCLRTKFAISLGTVSAFFSAFWMVLGHNATAMFDAAFSVAMLIIWAFGVSYLTFGEVETAPGMFLGNLYFGTWIGLLLTLQATGERLHGMLFKEETPVGMVNDDSRFAAEIKA